MIITLFYYILHLYKTSHMCCLLNILMIWTDSHYTSLFQVWVLNILMIWTDSHYTNLFQVWVLNILMIWTDSHYTNLFQVWVLNILMIWTDSHYTSYEVWDVFINVVLSVIVTWRITIELVIMMRVSCKIKSSSFMVIWVVEKIRWGARC